MKRVLLFTFMAAFMCAAQVSAKELRKKKMETDLKTRTVTITYDSDKTNIQKLKDGFAKFKYEAKVISDVEVK